MNPSDLWKKLPTPAELLENPQVRSVVDRLHPSVVTARVRGFLDEVRGEVAQRADAAGLPTLPELAQRVSSYLTGGGRYRLGGAINGTGRFSGQPWVSMPLAEAAIERMLLTAQDFTTCTDSLTPDVDAVRLLRELTDAQGAAVLGSHAGAIELALRSLPPSTRVVVARGEVATIEPGCRLTDLAKAAGVTLTEVGAADRVTIADYTEAISGSDSIVLRIDRPGHSTEDERPCLDELINSAKKEGAGVIVDLSGAAMGAVEGIEFTAPTVQQAIAWGATMVLARGDGLMGGPACGVIAGEETAVSRLTNLPLAAAAGVDAHRAAALAGTLELHRDPDKARLSIPALVLASTPVENLKTRAERLAPQIAASGLVGAAAPVERPSGSPSGLPFAAQSWAIRVTPGEQGLASLRDHLLSHSPSVQCAIDGDELLLDLRTVFPRQDLGILAAFEREGSDDSDEDSCIAPAD